MADVETPSGREKMARSEVKRRWHPCGLDRSNTTTQRKSGLFIVQCLGLRLQDYEERGVSFSTVFKIVYLQNFTLILNSSTGWS